MKENRLIFMAPKGPKKSPNDLAPDSQKALREKLEAQREAVKNNSVLQRNIEQNERAILVNVEYFEAEFKKFYEKNGEYEVEVRAATDIDAETTNQKFSYYRIFTKGQATKFALRFDKQNPDRGELIRIAKLQDNKDKENPTFSHKILGQKTLNFSGAGPGIIEQLTKEKASRFADERETKLFHTGENKLFKVLKSNIYVLNKKEANEMISLRRPLEDTIKLVEKYGFEVSPMQNQEGLDGIQRILERADNEKWSKAWRESTLRTAMPNFPIIESRISVPGQESSIIMKINLHNPKEIGFTPPSGMGLPGLTSSEYKDGVVDKYLQNLISVIKTGKASDSTISYLEDTTAEVSPEFQEKVNQIKKALQDAEVEPSRTVITGEKLVTLHFDQWKKPTKIEIEVKNNSFTITHTPGNTPLEVADPAALAPSIKEIYGNFKKFREQTPDTPEPPPSEPAPETAPSEPAPETAPKKATTFNDVLKAIQASEIPYRSTHNKKNSLTLNFDSKRSIKIEYGEENFKITVDSDSDPIEVTPDQLPAKLKELAKTVKKTESTKATPRPIPKIVPAPERYAQPKGTVGAVETSDGNFSIGAQEASIYASTGPSAFARKSPEKEESSKEKIKNLTEKIDKEFQIPREIVEAASDKLTWRRRFDRLKNRAIYTKEVKKLGAKNSYAVPGILQKIIDSKMTFDDILEATGSDMDTKEFKEAYAKGGNEKLYQIFESGIKVLEALEKDILIPFSKLSLSEKHAFQIEKAEETEEKAYNNEYLELNGILEGDVRKNGEVLLGISSEAIGQFQERIFPVGSDEKSTMYVMRSLLRAYDFGDLIANHQSVKKLEENETTKMVITSLPENFNLENPGVKILVKEFREDFMGDYDGDSFGIYLGPTEREIHEEKLKEVRNYTDSSVRTYKNKFLQVFKDAQFDDLGKIVQFIGTEAEDAGTEKTLYNSEAKYVQTSAIEDLSSPEALVDWIFRQPSIETYENGNKKSYQLFEYKKGVQVVNSEGVDNYLNHLIRKGKKREQLMKEHRERSVPFDEAIDKNFKLSKETLAKIITEKDSKAIEKVYEVTTSEPFNMSEAESQKFLEKLANARSKEISTEYIFESLLFENFKKAFGKPIGHRLSYTSLIGFDSKFYDPETGKHLNVVQGKSKGIPMINGKIESFNNFDDVRDQIQYLQLSQKTEPANAYKLLQVKRFVQASAVLGQRIQNIEKTLIEPATAAEKIKISNFSQNSINAEQFKAVSEGLVSEIMFDRTRQLYEVEEIMPEELSEYPKIEELQHRLLANGYPKSEIKSIESKVILAGAIALDSEGAIKGASPQYGGAIDLGHNFKLIGKLDVTGPSIGLAIDITKDNTFLFTVGYSNFIGHMATLETEDSATIARTFVGAHMTGATIPVVGVGASVGYDEGKAAKLRAKELKKEHGFDRIEEEQLLSQKASLLREHPYFKKIAQDVAEKTDGRKIDDIHILHIYEQMHRENLLTAMEQSTPKFPITEVGGGFGITPIGPAFFLGVKIRVGETPLVIPTVGENEDVAHALTNKQIKELLAQTSSSSKEIKLNSKDLYPLPDGGFAPVQRAEEIKFESTMDSFIEQANKANLSLKEAEITVNGKKEKVFELQIATPGNKELRLHVDKTSEDLAIFTENGTDGKVSKIYLPYSPKLNIVRAQFNALQRTKEGGPSGYDVIIISDKKEVDFHTITEQGRTMLRKTFEDGEIGEWEEVAGPNTEGQDNILNIKLEAIPSKHFDAQKESQKIFGIEQAQFMKIQETSKRLGKALKEKPVSALRGLESRIEDPTLRSEIYENLKKQIRLGRPSIADHRGIIQKVNQFLKTKDQPELNEKEAAQIYASIQHEYFTDLWKSEDKEKIKKAFKKHNNVIKKKILVPTFTERITELGIEPPKGLSKKAYARKLANLITEKNTAAFEKTLDAADLNAPETYVKAIEGQTLFAPGTTIRSTNKGALPLLLHHEAFNLPGVPKIGTVGDTIDWKLNSAVKEEQDIAKIILESLSPSPEARNPESFRSPIAIKLANFEIIGAELGAEAYEQLANFYEMPEADQNKLIEQWPDNEVTKALASFANIIEDIRQATLSADSSPVKITLEKTGVELFYIPKTMSGSYAECGNSSLALREEFFATGQLENQVGIIGSTLESIYTNEDFEKEVAEMLGGISIMPKAPTRAAAESEQETEVGKTGGRTDDTSSKQGQVTGSKSRN